MSRLRWGHSHGHGEAKIAEPTDNNYVLVWDLYRLRSCNKCIINAINTEADFAFQVTVASGYNQKGHYLT